MRKYLFPHQVSICTCYIHYCESKGTNYKCLHTFPFSVPWLPAHNQSFRFWSSHFCLTHWLCSVCKFLFNLVLSIYHYTAFFWHQQTLEHRKRKLYIYMNCIYSSEHSDWFLSRNTAYSQNVTIFTGLFLVILTINAFN